MMKPLAVLALVTLLPCALPAQAAERADTPRKGKVRLSFIPTVETWEAAFGPQGRQPVGGFLSGDSLGASAFPPLAGMQSAVQSASGLSAFAASLGRTLLAIRSERRVTPLAAEVGLTDRLSIGVMVPVVRVDVREILNVDSTRGNLGLNPLYFGGAPGFTTFFANFDNALAALNNQISGGTCLPRCAEALALYNQGVALRAALNKAVYGTGPSSQSPFLPLATSAAGKGIDTTVIDLQRQLQDSFGIAGFADTLGLPTFAAAPGDIEQVLSDPTFGYAYTPIERTPKFYRYWPGDAEVSAKYRMLETPTYAGAVKVTVRLPTGHLASPNDPFALSSGDHQTDVELGYIQELTLWNRLWLNLNVRAGVQLAGLRDARVAPQGAFWVPIGASARLDWKPGNYAVVDFAPMYRFNKQFSAGVTASYYRQGLDRYTYQSAADSVAVAQNLGAPVSASVLDAGTNRRYWQLGVAVTYQGPVWETGFSIQQAVTGWGGGTEVPAATTFRIVIRAFHGLF
ncbi:MAG TPA: hypothetical protein VJN62_08775 [Gemmatimonadales bacterium]|nr:hypothetical protein [Gemmatimonadales bacterium]